MKGEFTMDWLQTLIAHWEIVLVSVVLIYAAYIDGKILKVPNWITFPMVLSGLAYHTVASGWSGCYASLMGIGCGLLCLLPLYSIGGMGAGDVKLMAGIGAWLGVAITWNSFLVTIVVGAIMAIAMVIRSGRIQHHVTQFFHIAFEIVTIRDPNKLFAIAKERKPTMYLLPYGIPICVGSIMYFAYAIGYGLV
jgi:prepilin peptidase CpaA